MNAEIFGSIIKKFLCPIEHFLKYDPKTLMGTDVGAVETVGNRHGGTLEARVRGGVDPPTWRPGSAARQGRVRKGTFRTGGDVRVGCAKDVVHALNLHTPFCFSLCGHAVSGALPRRARASIVFFLLSRASLLLFELLFFFPSLLLLSLVVHILRAFRQRRLCLRTARVVAP